MLILTSDHFYCRSIALIALMIISTKSTSALLTKHASTTINFASYFHRDIVGCRRNSYLRVASNRHDYNNELCKSSRSSRLGFRGQYFGYGSIVTDCKHALSVITRRKLHYSSLMYSSSSTACQMTIADTPLGTEQGSLLLDGLDVYTVPAIGDGHPLSVYGIGNKNCKPKPDDHVLLMLHGRTWSSVPVYHLLGGPRNKAKGHESLSLMEALCDNKIKVYAMDFRGFGGTPNDKSRAVEPNRCVEDAESVLHWLAEQHRCPTNEKISLMGWSQGALVAQLAAQRHRPLFSRLILYGSIFDPLVRYPREPLYIKNQENASGWANTLDAALEDFTIEGTITPKAAAYFAEAALLTDPIKAEWKHLYQFNNCDPARIHVPTLVAVGDQDPYAPLRSQLELFANLGRGNDRSLSILSDADHAVHLLEGRSRFTNVVTSFIVNGEVNCQRNV